MEATFDNKTNVVNARIRAIHDNSVIYSLRTSFGFRGRRDTILCDENPAPGAATTVGAIHWQEKTLEISGHKKSCSELRRRAGRFFNRTRHWRWSPDRKEYEILYEQEEWKVCLTLFSTNMSIAGRFSVPFRPHLFSKSQPALLHLTKTALAEDEVFLILVFVYCEAKRQDRTVGALSPIISLQSVYPARLEQFKCRCGRMVMPVEPQGWTKLSDCMSIFDRIYLHVSILSTQLFNP
ncbi:hypothetical protein B0H11DRAFT_1735989 [Mycena galericulata]|nr:hypothetical protein B0H11DRAFT_1735989 [Mycena galericulata]